MSPSPYLLLPFFPFLPLGYSMDLCGAVGSDGLMASSSSNGGGGIIGSILASLDSDPSKQRVLFGSNHLKHGRSGAPDEHERRSLKVGRTNSHSLFPDGEQMLNFSSNAAASPYYLHLSSPSYARNPDLVYGITNGSMHGFLGGARSPFTPSQLMELKHQALIYTYIDTKMPIPSSLLNSIRRDYNPSVFSAFSAGFYGLTNPYLALALTTEQEEAQVPKTLNVTLLPRIEQWQRAPARGSKS